mgnify:FL=1
MTSLILNPGKLSLDDLQAIHNGVCQLGLPESARVAMRASHALVKAAADGDAPVYGVNTGLSLIHI